MLHYSAIRHQYFNESSKSDMKYSKSPKVSPNHLKFDISNAGNDDKLSGWGDPRIRKDKK